MEENIKLTIKTNGIFKILQPVFEDDELFDSELLEEKVISLINDGERNIIIDLSKVDYLYSDSINTFIELNHRIINVWGRIALYSPNENLLKILERSGIEKFLNIYPNEKEVENATKKIIEQTSSLNTKDIKNYKPEEEKKTSQQKNNALSIQQPVQNSSKDLILFEIQSFKDSLNSFCKDVLDPLIKKITGIEEKLLSETNITQKTSEEVPLNITLPEDDSTEEASLKSDLPEDNSTEEAPMNTDLQEDESAEEAPLNTDLQEDESVEEAPMKTDLQEDELFEDDPQKTDIQEDKSVEGDQTDDEQNDIQRIILDEKPDFTNLQIEENTLVDSDKKMSSDENEEFYLEDNI